MTTTTEKLTDDMITKLRDEAGNAGDSEMVAICQEALSGEPSSRRRVASAINDARAMDDSRPFVRVVVG